jgi:hypothetical protein
MIASGRLAAPPAPAEIDGDPKGRLVLLFDRRNIARHVPWFVFVVLATVGASVWFFRASWGAAQWPGGGSPPGLAFGMIGGGLILFEFLLWPRKKVRAWRVGRVQGWMIAHIWLGLLTVPLLIYHSGFRWGGWLSTVLMALFLVVIASGVWGLALQQILPTKMLQQVPAETIHSQIDRLVGFMVEDAGRLISATCGPLPGEDVDEVELREVSIGAPVSHMTVGAVQTVGKVQGKVLVTRVPRVAVPGSEPLRELFRSSIAPYLLQGKKSRSPLVLQHKADFLFRELKNKLGTGTHETIDILENLCDQRRQLDRQRRLHFWLHNWLVVHLPLSIALVILMVAHAWIAWKYR